jgi:hypothetical protein
MTILTVKPIAFEAIAINLFGLAVSYLNVETSQICNVIKMEVDAL